MKNRSLFLCLLLLPVISWGQGNKKTIIFVCEHGGARSTIASVYFNKMVKENHLAYQSIFRGLTPDSVITNETRKGLIADGFETALLSPVRLSAKEINSNTLLISLDCTVPPSYTRYHTWQGIAPISENYDAARNKILQLLNELVVELKNEKEAIKNLKHEP